MPSSVTRRRATRFNHVVVVSPFSQQQTNDSNTNLLSRVLLGDILVGTGVTLGVAPFLCIVDKAIVQHAAGTHTILSSCFSSISKIMANPVRFASSPMFLIMWSVYAATYSTANCLKSINEYQEYHYHHIRNKQTEQDHKMDKSKRSNDSSTTSSTIGSFGIFAGTTVVNSFASLLKDRSYARMFGTTPSKSLPLVSYGLFATRDCMVIGSSFLLPDYASRFLVNSTQLNATDAQCISQVVCPIATQFVVGPIQLLGLDFYNRPLVAGKSTTTTWQAAWWDRARFVYKGYLSVVAARVARIAPGYAIGGVLNTHYRTQWRNYLIQKQVPKLQTSQQQQQQQEEDASRLVGLVVVATSRQ